jgi:ribosome biogenesis GTPase A
VSEACSLRLQVADALNAKRAKRGLQPRPVRACVIGFPNIGKSAIINRLVNRRAVASAPKPGITRQLRWVRVDEQLDLLVSDGTVRATQVPTMHGWR